MEGDVFYISDTLIVYKAASLSGAIYGLEFSTLDIAHFLSSRFRDVNVAKDKVL